jgi:hypothetical protein
VTQDRGVKWAVWRGAALLRNLGPRFAENGAKQQRRNSDRQMNAWSMLRSASRR